MSKRRKDSARLIWDSKPKRAPNPRDIEFQTAEVVVPNPNRDLDQLPLSFKDKLFGEDDIDKREMNRLIWGDNLLAMQALLSQGYEGKIKLIYIDPPFDSKADYSHKVKIEDEEVIKEPSIIEKLAYKDTWTGGTDSYLDMLFPRLQLMRRLLASDGAIFVHLDWHKVSYIKVLMDEVFGEENFRNEIYCKRVQKNVQEYEAVKRLNVDLDTILFYGRSDQCRITAPRSLEKKEERWHAFDAPELRNGMDYELLGSKPPPGRHWMWEKGKAFEAVAAGIIRKNQRTGKPEYRVGSEFSIIGSLWNDLPAYAFKYGYETEKSERLVSRIIEVATAKGEIVADFFSGSGTTISVAESMNRRWIGCELGKVGIQISRSRLVHQDATPFLIENIGNYQREMIYLSGVKIKEMQRVVLKLYDAVQRKDTGDLGVRKDETGEAFLVHVGYPDRPVTAKKAEEILRTAEKLDGKGFKKVVILAWDYEPNFDQAFEARKKDSKNWPKVTLEPRMIPPDIYDYLKKAKDEEDIEPLKDKVQFFEKPYLRLAEPKVEKMKDGRFEVRIGIDRYTVFDFPVAKEADREKLRELVKDDFAVLIDYWSVDWDYDGYTFKSQWQDFRGFGKKATKVLTEVRHALDGGKEYEIMVRVVDIFGNDASGSVRVNLKGK